MCKHCEQGKPILQGTIDQFNDSFLFGLKQTDTLTFETICKAFEKEIIQVFIDKGHLRLTIGDDIGCLDHSVDLLRISFCPVCGKSISNKKEEE